MSPNRFWQIWQMRHSSNNNLMHDKSDKLFKIRNILRYLQHKFKTVYTPKQELLLDEIIIPWRGRLSFRIYNPAKLTKYGILVQMLSEGKSGYIYNFEVYSGAGAKFGVFNDRCMFLICTCRVKRMLSNETCFERIR